MPTERSMIYDTSGGALMVKTPQAAQNRIANMAANFEQFNTKNDPLPQLKRVNKVSTSSLEQQVSNPTSWLKNYL